MPDDPATIKEAEARGRRDGAAAAYTAACRILDRDRAAGVEDFGIIENILDKLAELAGWRV